MVDEHYDDVSLLLPMSGANNGTTFTDYSPSPKTVTRYGDTKTVTAESKYYGSSGYFDGSGDYLDVPPSADLAFGTGDFTVEFWIYSSSLASGFRRVIAHPSSTNAAGSFQIAQASSTLFGSVVDTVILPHPNFNTTNLVGTTSTITDGAWHHIAFSRQGTTLRAFFDGVLEATASDSTNFTLASTEGFRIGNRGDLAVTAYLHGYLQDLRLTKGVARYTANFTPPPRLILTVSGTVKDAADAFAARKVLTYREDTDALSGSATSNGTTGAFEIFVPPVKQRVVITGESDRNDLIFAGVEPV